jgi:hypothetical protein
VRLFAESNVSAAGRFANDGGAAGACWAAAMASAEAAEGLRRPLCWINERRSNGNQVLAML